jgi:virginiamycin B lyase
MARSRVDIRSNKGATIAAEIAREGGETAVGEGSMWAIVFGFPIAQIDPISNKVAAIL